MLVKYLAMKPPQNTPENAPSPPDNAIASLQGVIADLQDENAQLKSQLDWFKKQLFGPKSEKRVIENPHQGSLLIDPGTTAPEALPTITVPEHERGTGKKHRSQDCVTESGLRFTDEVPVTVISVVPPELSGPNADQYEVINTEVTHKLAQQPAGYVVLRYETTVIKHKQQANIVRAPLPDQVLEGSIADVSLLAGLLVDKFLYHLPLYRQHQRMSQLGVTVARASLTNWVKRAIELLRPIVDAQCRHILISKVLAMDETPIKAGLKHPGKMKQGYFWPLYGEDHEIVFTYSDSRGRQHIEETLKSQFQGVLVTDGYAAYARYASHTQGVVHAQCWVHSRRKFVEAESHAPQAVAHALALIGQLYQTESHIERARLMDEKKHQYRLACSKPVVDEFFGWCQQEMQRSDLTPKNPLKKALNYVLSRENELRVFLEDPDVPLDTNHLERAIRPIPLGRKNWLFCWTELGAEHAGIIQSLISTCKLQGVNPLVYLTDVLQRISVHPANRIDELTPRLWKEKFADNPMRSVVKPKVQYVME